MAKSSPHKEIGASAPIPIICMLLAVAEAMAVSGIQAAGRFIQARPATIAGWANVEYAVADMNSSK
ncbi:MAG: hypothetical protein ABI456_22735 [Ktedonobacteraceae bacterium]|nr:hypothetical protein [Chloroflexota bacterium]